MSFFGLFEKKKEKISLQHLKVDIHSHLLPGIDDGAKSMEDSLQMIHKFIQLGYQKLIITPHVKKGVFNNNKEILLFGHAALQKEINNKKWNIETEISAEYFYDDHFVHLINSNELLPFMGNHILFELSFHTPPKLLDELIFSLQNKGFQPILAHFERYIYYHNKPQFAKQLQDRNVLIQVNANSFSGHYGPEIKLQAKKLLKNGWIDILGTDCHRLEHLTILENSLSKKEFHDLMKLPLKNNLFA